MASQPKVGRSRPTEHPSIGRRAARVFLETEQSARHERIHEPLGLRHRASEFHDDGVAESGLAHDEPRPRARRNARVQALDELRQIDFGRRHLVARRFGFAFGLAFAFAARAFGADALRTALRSRFAVRFARPVLLRVDFRLGLPVAESSAAAPPFASARADLFRARVDPPPALRFVALTPGFAVSTGVSRRLTAFRFGFGGFAARAALALKTSDRVAIGALYQVLARGVQPG